MINKSWVIPALMRCMHTCGECPTDCPGYAECIANGADIMTEAGKMMEAMTERTAVLVNALSGVDRVHLYFATKAPVSADKLPEDGYIAHVNHRERKYIRLIDDMAYGTVIYSRALKPWEIEMLRLTSAPRE